MIFILLKDILFAQFRTPIGDPYPVPVPSLADAVTVTGAAGAWAYGAYVTVIAPGDTTKLFAIEEFLVEGITAGAICQMDIATGTAGNEVVRRTLRFRTAGERVRCGIGPIDAGTTVRVRIATKAGGAQTADFSFLRRYLTS